MLLFDSSIRKSETKTQSVSVFQTYCWTIWVPLLFLPAGGWVGELGWDRLRTRWGLPGRRGPLSGLGPSLRHRLLRRVQWGCLGLICTQLLLWCQAYGGGGSTSFCAASTIKHWAQLDWGGTWHQYPWGTVCTRIARAFPLLSPCTLA